MMDLVFCGTPPFAVPTLQRLFSAGFHVRLVVTQPDRPSGRGMEFAASPVKREALQLDLPLTQPDKIKNNEEFRAQLEIIRPQAIVVVGYGRIIPQWMIELPPLGNINLHASLLPKYRGAAPIQWAIASGESVTGVTTMRIDAGLDTGDILEQREEPIRDDDTALTLAPRLAHTGAELVITSLAGLLKGTITPRPQDNGSRRSHRSSPKRTALSISLTPRKKPGIAFEDFSRGRERSPAFAASCSTSIRHFLLPRSPLLLQDTSRLRMSDYCWDLLMAVRWRFTSYRWKARSA